VVDTPVACFAAREPVPARASSDGGAVRDPLTWTKRLRLRRWVLREFSKEHGAVVRTAAVDGRRQEFSRHAARASALARIFEVTGGARDEITFLVLDRAIEPAAWDAAYLAMRTEIEGKLASLGLLARRPSLSHIDPARSAAETV
jgi:hypothetical protein